MSTPKIVVPPVIVEPGQAPPAKSASTGAATTAPKRSSLSAADALHTPSANTTTKAAPAPVKTTAAPAPAAAPPKAKPEPVHEPEVAKGPYRNAHHVAKGNVGSKLTAKKDDGPLFSVKSNIQIDNPDHIVQQLFDMYVDESINKVFKADIIAVLEEQGLKVKTDPRLASIAQIPPKLQKLSFADFVQYVKPSLETVYQAASGQMTIPDFKTFSNKCEELIHDSEYPPIAMAVCTVDGQQNGFGPSHEHVCLQEISNCVTYLMARQELGREKVHSYIGREYSGFRSDEIALNDDGKPHNPLTNLGGLMCASLVKPGKINSERYSAIQKTIKRMVAGLGVHFDNDMYASQRENMFREEAMAFFLKEKNETFDVEESLNLYFQAYSIEMTLESLSVLAATIANRGVCPITGDQIFKEDAVRDLLAMMYVSGMDLSSGEYAFKVGFPAKNAMSGVVMSIVPGVMGVCTLEEPQDSLEVITCMEFMIEFSFTFPFGTKAVHSNVELQPRTSGASTFSHFDPRSTYASVQATLWSDLTSAIYMDETTDAIDVLGSDVFNQTDFYKRTLLHLAAIQGKARLIMFFLERGADPDRKDAFGKTARDYVDPANTAALEAFTADLDVERPVSRGVSRMY